MMCVYSFRLVQLEVTELQGGVLLIRNSSLRQNYLPLYMAALTTSHGQVSPLETFILCLYQIFCVKFMYVPNIVLKKKNNKNNVLIICIKKVDLHMKFMQCCWEKCVKHEHRIDDNGGFLSYKYGPVCFFYRVKKEVEIIRIV